MPTIAVLTMGMPSGCDHLKELTKEDFETAKWIKYDNTGSGRIWSNYMFEDIPRSQENWALYVDQVRKKNGEYLNKEIMLPDLDGNGEVDKR